tara:strand:+ start:6529 stop:8427 length:1899 start_codon:yes stop_codon:yes gene_type:complete
MPLQTLDFQPGVDKEGTDYSAKGGWVDSNLIRFRKGRVEKLGGWLKLGSTYFLGKARALHSWISLGGVRYLGIGTTVKYYIEEGEAFYDITPIRSTTSAGDVTFSATNGSSTITVADTAHGAVNGDFVTFSGAASLGGNVTAAVLNQEYQIDLVTTANAYTITAKDTDGTTVTANSSDSGNGGSSTVGTYQINVGLDTFVQSSGWGLGTWGAGGFGSASSISAVNQLRLWTHDNYGENLIINPRGAGIFRWVENNGVNTRALELSGITGANLVPTVALQVLTSETDRHLIVLGADPISGSSRTGVVDPMLIAFSDQENELEFEPTTTNTAGSLRLSSGSFIVGGIKSRQEVLIFTDTSLYSMNFIGPPLTFALNLVNEGSGLIGPKAAANASNGVFYASKTAFYFYNGSVKKLPCSVQEFVFNDLDLGQAFKCHMGINSEFGEMWFFYPSIEDGTGEISRYVIYNYEENNWAVGSLVRYSWLDAGIEDLPLSGATTSSGECIFQHETGFDDDGAAMTGVFIESADLDISSGDSFSFIKKIIPDMKFVTDPNVSSAPAMNIVLKRRDFPGQSLTVDSTNQVTESSTFSNVRSRARQMVFRFESDDDNTAADQLGYKWRLGSTRIDIQPSGRRA